MKYKVIIFDWDGTLMDSIDKIVACVKAAAVDAQLNPPSTADIRNIVGLSLDNAMKILFPDTSLLTRETLIEGYRQHFLTDSGHETPFYEGIVDWLINLKEQGYLLAVATGKSRRGLNLMLEKFAVGELFSVTYCADETASKPDPLMLNRILHDLDCDVSHALMVGDSSYDLAMANNAGMDCLGVSYGVHDKALLKQFKPIAILDDLPKEFSHYV